MRAILCLETCSPCLSDNQSNRTVTLQLEEAIASAKTLYAQESKFLPSETAIRSIHSFWKGARFENGHEHWKALALLVSSWVSRWEDGAVGFHKRVIPGWTQMIKPLNQFLSCCHQHNLEGWLKAIKMLSDRRFPILAEFQLLTLEP